MTLPVFCEQKKWEKVTPRAYGSRLISVVMKSHDHSAQNCKYMKKLYGKEEKKIGENDGSFKQREKF